MKILFTPRGLEDFYYWKKHNWNRYEKVWVFLYIELSYYKGTIYRIPDLIIPLMGSLSGLWTFRISKIQHLIFTVDKEKEEVIVYSCRRRFKKKS